MVAHQPSVAVRNMTFSKILFFISFTTLTFPCNGTDTDVTHALESDEMCAQDGSCAVEALQRLAVRAHGPDDSSKKIDSQAKNETKVKLAMDGKASATVNLTANLTATLHHETTETSEEESGSEETGLEEEGEDAENKAEAKTEDAGEAEVEEDAEGEVESQEKTDVHAALFHTQNEENATAEEERSEKDDLVRSQGEEAVTAGAEIFENLIHSQDEEAVTAEEETSEKDDLVRSQGEENITAGAEIFENLIHSQDEEDVTAEEETSEKDHLVHSEQNITAGAEIFENLVHSQDEEAVTAEEETSKKEETSEKDDLVHSQGEENITAGAEVFENLVHSQGEENIAAGVEVFENLVHSQEDMAAEEETSEKDESAEKDEDESAEKDEDESAEKDEDDSEDWKDLVQGGDEDKTEKTPSVDSTKCGLKTDYQPADPVYDVAQETHNFSQRACVVSLVSRKYGACAVARKKRHFPLYSRKMGALMKTRMKDQNHSKHLKLTYNWGNQMLLTRKRYDPMSDIFCVATGWTHLPKAKVVNFRAWEGLERRECDRLIAAHPEVKLMSLDDLHRVTSRLSLGFTADLHEWNSEATVDTMRSHAAMQCLMGVAGCSMADCATNYCRLSGNGPNIIGHGMRECGAIPMAGRKH